MVVTYCYFIFVIRDKFALPFDAVLCGGHIKDLMLVIRLMLI